MEVTERASTAFQVQHATYRSEQNQNDDVTYEKSPSIGICDTTMPMLSNKFTQEDKSSLMTQ